MADTKISALTALTNPVGTDLLSIVDDVAGIPTTKKITLNTLLQDGWFAPDETWTYASATTFTVSGDVTATYSAGTKLKMTQTSAKYFHVLSSSYSAPNTTVTVITQTDYTIANAAITSPYFSYTNQPRGFPGYFAFTPTITAGSGTFTTVSAVGSFMVAGRTFFADIVITITTNGTAAVSVYATLPVTGVNSQVGAGRENAVTGDMLQVYLGSGQNYFTIYDYLGNYPGGTGYSLVCSGRVRF